MAIISVRLAENLVTVSYGQIVSWTLLSVWVLTGSQIHAKSQDLWNTVSAGAEQTQRGGKLLPFRSGVA